MSLTKRLLLTILLMFTVVAFLFMSFTLYGEYLFYKDKSVGTETIEAPKISAPVSGGGNIADSAVIPGASGEEKEETLLSFGAPVRRVGVVSFLSGDETVSVAKEWCSYNRYSCTLFTDFPEKEKIKNLDFLIFGSCSFTESSAEILKSYGETSVTMIFAEPPDFDLISKNPSLADCFGIDQTISGSYKIDGIRLFGDFYLSGDRIYTKDDDYGTKNEMRLYIPYYTLRPGYEVFAVAILDNQEVLGIDNEKMPPLLWRTNLGSSKAYVIGIDFFRGDALIGTLSAIAGDSEEAFVYPILNVQMNSIINFPWMTEENSEQVKSVYGHTPKSLAQDIIWPSIIQTLFSYHSTADFYVGTQIDYGLDLGYNSEIPEYYTKQMKKRLATMGLSLGEKGDLSLDEIIDKNTEFFDKTMPGCKFSTLYSGRFSGEILKPYLADKNGLLGGVHYIVSDRSTDAPVVSALDGDKICVQLTTNGFSYKAKDDINLISLYTALGYNNQYIKGDSVLYPESSKDYWNNRSITWASQTTYYKEFSDFDFATMKELKDKASDFLSLSYNWYADGSKICIYLNTDNEISFILRLNKDEIKSVKGAEYTKLTDTAYIVKSHSKSKQIIIKTERLHHIDAPA